MAKHGLAIQQKELKDKIPFFNSTRQYLKIKKDIDRAINYVIESGCYVNGVANKTFEQELAKYCGVSYAVTVANGTAALYLALLEAGVGEGHNVLVPSHTFIATIEAITLTGARPVFCDISPYSYNIRLDEIEKKCNSQTKAIIPVHMYGNMCDMDAISSFAKGKGIKVIEDACQAIGSEVRGKKAGSVGEFGCFSFYPTKNLGTYGEGGAIVTNNRLAYDNLIAMRNHNELQKHFHEFGGFNFRMSEIQAAILLVKIRHLDDWIVRRRQIADIYRKSLKDHVTKPEESKNSKHSYHLYVIRVEKREAFCNHLEKRGVGFGVHYPIPCHTQYQIQDNLPFTDLVTKQIVSLPMFPELTDKEAIRVCEVINGF